MVTYLEKVNHHLIGFKIHKILLTTNNVMIQLAFYNDTEHLAISDLKKKLLNFKNAIRF